MKNRWLDIEEAADFWMVSPIRVLTWVARGQIRLRIVDLFTWQVAEDDLLEMHVDQRVYPKDSLCDGCNQKFSSHSKPHRFCSFECREHPGTRATSQCNAVTYFIEGGDTGWIKIGKTTNAPDSRRANFQVGCPPCIRLSLLGFVNAPEELVHAHFAADRYSLNCEWFRDTPRLRAFISHIQEHGSLPSDPREWSTITTSAKAA